jgi:hypothetical protein
MTGRVEVQIGRITVRGTPTSPAALRRAVEKEIASLVRAPGALDRLWQGGSVERLAAPLNLDGPGDRALGRGVARAALGAVTGEDAP